MAKSRGVLVGITFFIGAIFALSGFVFTLQGFGMIGPTSSFMFLSQTWIFEGIGILAVGLVILGLAFFFRRRTNSSSITLENQSNENQNRNATSA
jgi:hypothetical protein